MSQRRTRPPESSQSRGPANPDPNPAEVCDPETEILNAISILVVDHDPNTLASVEAAFTPYRVQVRGVSSAERALAEIDAFRPDVILVELVLPLMSGILFAETLGADPRGRGVQLIAVTGFNSRAEQIARSVGFAGYLSKPLEADSIVRVVRSALRGRT